MAHKRLNLIAARTDAGFSQEALAEKLNSNRVTVSNWENGLTEPYPHFKGKLKTLFGIDLSTLLHVFEVADDEEGPLSMQTRPHPIVWQQPPPSAQHFIVNHPTRHFWQIAHTDYRTPNELTAAIQAAIKELHTMTGDLITRRDALCELASIPLISLGKTQTLKASRYEEMLRFCTAALEGCFELYRGSDPVGAKHAFDCTTTYVSLLETIAHNSSNLRKQAIDLATQCAILKTMLGWKFLKRTESIWHAQYALELSKESNNILLQLSARSKLSYTYVTAKNYKSALETMREGEHEAKEYQRKNRGQPLPSGIIGNFYSGYATAQVYNGVDPDTSLKIAADSESIRGHIAFIEFTTSEQTMEAAWTYCAGGNFEQAMEQLSKLLDTHTLALLPDTELSSSARIHTINTLTSTLLQSPQQDMGQIIRTWTTAMEGAQEHRNDVMYDAAMTNLAVMRNLWRGEEAIRKLMPMTSHW